MDEQKFTLMAPSATSTASAPWKMRQRAAPVGNSSLKARLYVSNILVGIVLLLGFAGIATAIVGKGATY